MIDTSLYTVLKKVKKEEKGQVYGINPDELHKTLRRETLPEKEFSKDTSRTTRFKYGVTTDELGFVSPVTIAFGEYIPGHNDDGEYIPEESKYEIDVIVEEDLYENPKANSVMYEFKTYQEAFNYLDENKDLILQNFLKLHDLFVVEDIE